VDVEPNHPNTSLEGQIEEAKVAYPLLRLFEGIEGQLSSYEEVLVPASDVVTMLDLLQQSYQDVYKVLDGLQKIKVVVGRNPHDSCG